MQKRSTTGSKLNSSTLISSVGQQQTQSSVFSASDVEVFRRVFDKLAKGAFTINVQAYVAHVKEMAAAREEGVLSVIIKELEADGDLDVNFEEFLRLLEQKVGDLKTTEGLQRIFRFITKDAGKQKVTIEDLVKVRDELGLTVSNKELQRLVNFVTTSYKERSDFSFEEFRAFALKHNNGGN